jgi:hypothetical protein
MTAFARKAMLGLSKTYMDRATSALSKLKIEFQNKVMPALTKLKVFRQQSMLVIESRLTEHSAEIMLWKG